MKPEGHSLATLADKQPSIFLLLLPDSGIEGAWSHVWLCMWVVCKLRYSPYTVSTLPTYPSPQFIYFHIYGSSQLMAIEHLKMTFVSSVLILWVFLDKFLNIHIHSILFKDS